MQAPGSELPAQEPLLTRILIKRFLYRHPKAWGSMYLVAGCVHVLLGLILSAYGYWWGTGLIAVAVLELWVAHRLLVAPLPLRVRQLERSRARAVDGAAEQLRRIERDLHDGAQAQLLAVAMKLALAQEKLAAAIGGDGRTDLPRVLELVVAAQNGATVAITELRDLARGIHPPVLDQGLGPALATLAARNHVPVDLTVDVPERPSAAIETIAYFCAAELLTNVAKHSDARHATIEAVHAGGVLRVAVSDDGTGGARLDGRGGLWGLLERVGTVDGKLWISSPPGGPTSVTVELPSRA
jgi:signal transduction histidine kinase